MSRDFQIFGECLVQVRGYDIVIDINNKAVDTELGLAVDQIRISPQFNYQDLRADDFGQVPPETLWMLGTTNIGMGLIHYDSDVLSLCTRAALGGADDESAMTGAGLPMGGGVALGSSGNHYVTLTLSPTGISGRINPYIFPACHLTAPPMMIPIGTERSIALLNWRSIPYVGPYPSTELVSQGTTLWNRTSGQ